MTNPTNDALQKPQSTVQANTDTTQNVDKIIEYVTHDNWDQIIKLIDNGLFMDLNIDILNGNNIFHLACIKGKTNIIKQLIQFKQNGKIKLNTNKLNIDGLPGIHLYYKYGGNEISFFNNDEICYLDGDSRNLAIYLLDKLPILEIFIDKLIAKQCIDNLEIPFESNKHYFFYEIAKRVSLASLNTKILNTKTQNTKNDITTMDRYLEILRKLYAELRIEGLVFMGIYLNSPEIIKLLMDFDFDFMVYAKNKLSPLSMGIFNGFNDIVHMILEYTQNKFGEQDVFNMINQSDKNYEFRPIFVAIKTNNYYVLRILITYMLPYIKEYENAHNETLQFKREIDNFQNQYLHRILAIFADRQLLQRDISQIPDPLQPNTMIDVICNVPLPIISFFVKHCDLNQTNYADNTPAHIIFSTGLWKFIINDLKNREIDLLKIDQFGKNCYSYILPNDKAQFLKLTEHIVIPLEEKHNNADKTDKIKLMLDIDSSNFQNQTSAKEKTENYGLFNSNMVHYMLYLRYIENKHKNIYVPVRLFDDNSRQSELFFFDLTSYPISSEQKTLNNCIENYLSEFYSYLPHNIYWINSGQYFIDPCLVDVLKNHNKTIDISVHRYVMLKLTMIVNKRSLHANVLIYDRLKKEAWRFEPYGMSDVTTGHSMDRHIYSLLTDIYGKIHYHDPDDFLIGLNFQLVTGDEFTENQNLGDPDGYCLAWSMWFTDMVLEYPDKNVDDLMKDFFNTQSINSIISNEELNGVNITSTNPFLDFIRRYAHKLDREKNNILSSIGIKKYNIYNYIPDNDILQKISDHFKILPTNNSPTM